MNWARSVVIVTLCVACAETSGHRDPAGPSTAAADLAAGDVLVGAGNIAKCTNNNDEATAQLLDAIPGTVAPLGDNAFPSGRLVDYQNCYGPSWGRHLSRTQAVLGNHEYDSSATADGAFDYFGSRIGPRGLGYYSYDIGSTWHVVVLNDNSASVPWSAGSVQDQWLVNDLAANARPCVIAMFHNPYFLSSNSAGFTVRSTRKIIWDRLHAAGAEIVLNGQEHHYERMAPMRPDGTRDDSTGIREFIVGTGGESVALPTTTIHPNSEVRGAVFGVLKLTLRDGAYDWEFVPVAGQTFTDAGSGNCSGAAPPPPPPANTPPTAAFTTACNGLTCDFSDGSSDSDGTIANWGWTFGDGATSTTRNPSHSYAAGGTYTVRLTVTDDDSATASTTRTVTLNRAPVADAGGPYTSEDRVVFDGAGSSDPDGDTPLTYAWTFGDGSTGSGAAPAHVYTADGTYTVTLIVTDAKGMSSSADQATVTIGNLPPTVDAGPDATMIPGVFTLRARFTDPGANDAPWRYTITWGDALSTSGSTSSQSEITAVHPYVLPGTYRVRVTVTDKDGGSATDEMLVTVKLPL